MSVSGPPSGGFEHRPQWRGVLEEYRPLIDLLPDGMEPVTLREGGTPLVNGQEFFVWLIP